MRLLLSVLVALVAISIIPTVFSDSIRGEFTIPNWVKNTAGWWADGQIDDSAFLQAIEFLINEDIVTVQIPVVESEVVEGVPGWVKNTAGWWGEDKIHDVAFVGAIKYLIGQGIMTVDEKQVAEELPICSYKIILDYACIVEEVVEVNDFYMEVNGGNCCQNWAYVGEDYKFQIKTFDEYRGNAIDGVTITAKIISKDGELRYDFGQITTEDGFYENRLTIPSMDWYAGNILSVTGEYFGVEKTIEKEFEVFVKKNKVRICINISCYTLASVGNVVDGSNALNGVRGVAIATIGSSTYAVAASEVDDGIQIIDISNPNSPSAVGKLLDTDGTFELNGAVGLTITTIGGSTYAVVAANADSGISIIDISTPSSPSHVGLVSDDGDKLLKNAYHVAIATIGGSTYAVVTGNGDDGIEIIDISTPSSPSSVGRLADDSDKGGCTSSDVCLDNPVDVAIATIGGSTYAVVVAHNDDGVEIIDISDPTNPSSVGRITKADDTTRELNASNGLALATIGGSTYAVVTGHDDDGISIIDISTPASPVYVGELEDGTDTGKCTAVNGERCLDGPRGVAVEKINGRTYAVVAVTVDDAVTIIDITEPTSPSIVAQMYDGTDTGVCTAVNGEKCLDGAKGVAIATIGGNFYAVIGGTNDDGIEVIRIMD